jgi:hypothetical protein
MNVISEEKFPGLGSICVGAIFFLRFFCPAIISPQNFDILNAIPNTNARRTLILIAKIIQLLANNMKLEKESFIKEPFLIPFLEMMKRNKDNLDKFTLNISTYDQGSFDYRNVEFKNYDENLVLISLLSLQDYFFDAEKLLLKEKKIIDDDFIQIKNSLL